MRALILTVKKRARFPRSFLVTGRHGVTTPFGRPGRKALDVEVVFVKGGIIAVAGKLELVLDLVARHGHATNGAALACASPCPHPVRVTAGQVRSFDHCAVLRMYGGLVTDTAGCAIHRCRFCHSMLRCSSRPA
jgi:hypothetical protein